MYRHLIPGLIAGAVGYGVYSAILHTSYLGVYGFPDFAALRVVDLVWALLVGVIAGAIGILHKLVFGLTHRVFGRFNKRPVIRAIIGGLVIGLIGSFLPLTLYSGQNQLLQIIHNPASYGVGILLLMMLVKMLLTGTSFATGFDGGPIFPITIYRRYTGTGSIRNSNIHSTGCGCTCRYGSCRMCFPPASLNNCSPTGAIRRTD